MLLFDSNTSVTYVDTCICERNIRLYRYSPPSHLWYRTWQRAKTYVSVASRNFHMCAHSFSHTMLFHLNYSMGFARIMLCSIYVDIEITHDALVHSELCRRICACQTTISSIFAMLSDLCIETKCTEKIQWIIE